MKIGWTFSHGSLDLRGVTAQPGVTIGKSVQRPNPPPKPKQKPKRSK